MLVDLDGCLIDMVPFAAELDDEPPGWVGIFSHTSDANPIEEGVEFVAALHRVGWRYTISTTRPHGVRDGKTFVPQLAAIQSWVKTNLPAQPRWIYMRAADQTTMTPADVNRGHFLASAESPLKGMKTLPAILAVDDEFEVVDQLVDHGIPALHVGDLTGTSDHDLESLLAYGAAQAQHVHAAQSRCRTAAVFDLDPFALRPGPLRALARRRYEHERHLTKLKVKPRGREEVERPDVRRRAGRFAGSDAVDRGVC